MRGKYLLITIVLLTLGFGAGRLSNARLSAASGTLDSPGPPESTYSYTLEDIYNRLNAGTEGSQSTFTEPTSGPTVGTGHTLIEIMAVAPEIDITNGATQGDVVAGKTFWGLTSAQWGLTTGTMADNGAIVYTPSTSNQTVAAGYHNGSGYVEGDAYLVAGNIRDGVFIFDVKGTYPRAGVPATGQIGCWNETGGSVACAGTGQDGAYQKDVVWPLPRFADNATATVTDNLTKLIWLKDANCMQTKYPGFDTDGTAGDGRVNWQHALDFVTGINDGTYPDCGESFTDWRLPNLRELLSLIHYGVYTPAIPNTLGTGKWTEGAPFVGIKSSKYWSSTTDSFDGSSAWYVYVNVGSVNVDTKATTGYVWPVRGGQ